MNIQLASAFVDSMFPICYRLVFKNVGYGNMLPVLQGHFLFTTNGGGIGSEWRALGRSHWVRVDLAPSRPSLLELARKIHVPVFDETDRFLLGHGLMSKREARAAFLDSSLGKPWEEQADG